MGTKPMGVPFGLSWGEDTGYRVGDREIRVMRGHDSISRLYETGPDGCDQIREIWISGRHVGFSSRTIVPIAAERIAKAGGYLLNPCKYCRDVAGVHLSDDENGAIFVECEECGAQGPHIGLECGGYQSQIAADLWNEEGPRPVEFNTIEEWGLSISKNKGVVGLYDFHKGHAVLCGESPK